jgi:hypothetical protein
MNGGNVTSATTGAPKRCPYKKGMKVKPGMAEMGKLDKNEVNATSTFDRQDDSGYLFIGGCWANCRSSTTDLEDFGMLGIVLYVVDIY